MKDNKNQRFSNFRISSRKFRNKKAVSAVVATVLLILITIAAVGIIGVVVVPMVRDKLSAGSACFDAVSQVSLVTDQGYTCLNETSGNIKIHIAHGPKDFELADVQVLISTAGDTESRTLVKNFNYSVSDLPGANDKKVFELNESFKNADRVQIAPIVKLGDAQEICDISSTAILKSCG